MEHSEAVEQMTAERYLLNELAPDEREAFEEHAFDCTECALDLRAGAAFVDEAKALLPDLTATLSVLPPAKTRKQRTNRNDWFSWMRPAFAAPAFAALLLVLGYQNLVTLPALRATANQPHLLASIPLRGATRGADHQAITADRIHGVALPFDFYRQTDTAGYASYSFDLYDPQGKLAWSGAIAVPDDREGGGQRISLAIPGAMLKNGAYTVAVTGIGPRGERTEVERQVFDLHVND
ncbi:MAG: zf-HC2 domain-containing protein [Terracidiphilus sp.]|nr:zf-HC2 domain-containing protein [Terracidiphilus sp.]